MCCCGNGGGTDTKIRVSTESRPWRRKFSRHSCRDSNPWPFNHESGALNTELSPPRGVLCVFFLNSRVPPMLVWLLSRGSNTFVFALRSFLIRLPCTFQNFFTFTFLPGSSALLQTLLWQCEAGKKRALRLWRLISSEYHPSEQSHVVSALSLTRLKLPGTRYLFLSATLPLSALLNLPWKPFSF